MTEANPTAIFEFRVNLFVANKGKKTYRLRSAAKRPTGPPKGEEQEKQVVEWVGDWVRDRDFKVKAEAMSADDPPILITRPEFLRRMNEMAATGGSPFLGGPMKETVDMVVNAAHPLVQQLALTNDESSRTSLGQNLIDLALLSQGMLSGAPLAAFIERSLQSASKP